MIDEALLQAAIRSRAESLVVATTGSATLSATATGYARATGSFITDKFLVGQEVTPSAFTQTTPGLITAVSALALEINGGRTVQAAGSGRSLVVGLPALRAYDNKTITPLGYRHFITEELVPGATVIKTWPTRLGRFQEEWLSVWTWYGVAGTGAAGIRACVDAFKRLFASGTNLALSDSTSAFVRGDVAIKSGQILPVDGGWARCTITIPLRGSTQNVIAA